jgi:hypothetical protein
MLKCSRGASRLFRNNIGALQDRTGRFVTYGVGNPGGSDLLGWVSVVVTDEMVGARIAIFTSIEVKRLGEHPALEQLDWLAMVTAAGGRAGVAHSAEEAQEIIDGR